VPIALEPVRRFGLGLAPDATPARQLSLTGIASLHNGLKENSSGETGRRASDLCDRVVDFVANRRSTAPRKGMRVLSGAGASGSKHLPWALPRVLHAIGKINRPSGGNGRLAGRGRGGVCSRDASSVFTPGTRDSGIAARAAGRRRGNGRGGRPRRDTGPPGRVNRSATGRAGAIGTVSGTETTRERGSWRGREGHH
jgi:hypothetical protein